MPTLALPALTPAFRILAAFVEHRRIVPVPLQFVLATIGGVLLVAAIVALWRAEQKTLAARRHPLTGLLGPDALRLDSAARIDRRGPVALVAIDGNGTDPAAAGKALEDWLAPVLRPADLLGHVNDDRFAVVVPVGGDAAHQIARRAAEQGYRCGVGVAPSGMKSSFDALLAQALGSLDAGPAPDRKAWPDPVPESLVGHPRTSREPASGALTRSSFLAQLERLIYARQLPEGAEVIVVAVDVDAAPGPDGVTPDPAPFLWTRETLEGALRAEDCIGRVARHAMAAAAVLRKETAGSFVKHAQDAFVRRGRISAQWNSHSLTHTGFARYPHDAKTAAGLVRCALAALRQAVADGTREPVGYDPARHRAEAAEAPAGAPAPPENDTY